MAVRTLRFPQGSAWRQRVQLQGRSYIVRCFWNTRDESWWFALNDRDDEKITTGKLVLGYPLMWGLRDDRRPPGEFFVVEPSQTDGSDPGREAFVDGSYRLIYVEA